jgi:hypothetical protein
MTWIRITGIEVNNVLLTLAQRPISFARTDRNIIAYSFVQKDGVTVDFCGKELA